MDLGLEGKSVIVAASSKGLGKAIAQQFAEVGASVMLFSRTEADLKRAAEEITKKTGNRNIRYQVCDVTNASAINRLIDATIEWTGKVDILINNAGGPPAGVFDNFSDDDWEQAFQLNLMSYIRLIRGVLPSMRATGTGRIVNVASSSIKESLDNLILSNTFRAGIVGLSKSLARELAAENILINTVGPGRFSTERVNSLDEIEAEAKRIPFEEFQKQTKSSIPMGRYGEPEEFAKIIVFLASEANTYMTGQSIVIDGGLVRAL